MARQSSRLRMEGVGSPGRIAVAEFKPRTEHRLGPKRDLHGEIGHHRRPFGRDPPCGGDSQPIRPWLSPARLEVRGSAIREKWTIPTCGPRGPRGGKTRQTPGDLCPTALRLHGLRLVDRSFHNHPDPGGSGHPHTWRLEVQPPPAGSRPGLCHLFCRYTPPT